MRGIAHALLTFTLFAVALCPNGLEARQGMKVTIHDPDRAYQGYTLLTCPYGAGDPGLNVFLVNMEGKLVHAWMGFRGDPAKLMPGGYIAGHTWSRGEGRQDTADLIVLDWEAREVRRWNGWEVVTLRSGETVPMARQHHDYEFEGSPTGYFTPDPTLTPKPFGKILVLAHSDTIAPAISNKPIIDDVIYEVSEYGELTGFFWSASEHIDEMGLSPGARRRIDNYINPDLHLFFGDWLHINSISTLGPNNHYDSGDNRFDPDNIIWSSRHTNILAIIDRRSGKIVWKLGPGYEAAAARGWSMGPLIGMHHGHMIPKGLPGQGNILVFDNGGAAGFGKLSSLGGFLLPYSETRWHSRVIEFDPVTLETIWTYEKPSGFLWPFSGEHHRFFSFLISSAQRLPNGNTLIAEGQCGRVFEVTSDGDIVWELLLGKYAIHPLYRAYRVPFEWVPHSGRSAR